MYFTGNGIMSLAFPTSLAPRGADTAQRTADAVAPRRGKSVRRRLPVTRTWPTAVVVLVQMVMLVAFIALWEISAAFKLIDPFFWSRPSAIWATLLIFFTEGNALVDIGFTFRSTIIGFVIGTLAGSLLGLSMWWSRNYASDRAALHHLPGIDPEARARAAHHPGVRHGTRVEGRHRDRADARGLGADRLFGRAVGRQGPGAAVLFARREPLAGLHQAGGADLRAVDHLDPAREHRPGADRLDRRRVRRLAARARAHHPLRRHRPTTSRSYGSRCSCSRSSRSSCTPACRGSKAC